MRLWSLHPKYLDSCGLSGLWREALLAQSVLCGSPKRGYQSHPQLDRFRPFGKDGIAQFLLAVAGEADKRQFNFNRSLIAWPSARPQLTVTSEQLLFEAQHLLSKLSKRNPLFAARLDTELQTYSTAEPHPLFTVVRGPIEVWERGNK